MKYEIKFTALNLDNERKTGKTEWEGNYENEMEVESLFKEWIEENTPYRIMHVIAKVKGEN